MDRLDRLALEAAGMTEHQRNIQRRHQLERWITSLTFNTAFTDQQRRAELRRAKQELRTLNCQITAEQEKQA